MRQKRECDGWLLKKLCSTYFFKSQDQSISTTVEWSADTAEFCPTASIWAMDAMGQAKEGA